MILEIKGKRYKSIDDLENTFTLEQLKIAKPIITELISALPSKLINKLGKVRTLKEGETYTDEETELIENLNQEYTQALFKLISEWNKDAEILALLFLEETEETFELETYKTRIKEFSNIPMKDLERCGEQMKSFFPTIVKFMQVNILTSFLQGAQ